MIIQHRRGTTSEWELADLIADSKPEVILKEGEFAIEECVDGSRRIKLGDGHSKFFALPYIDERVEFALLTKLLEIKETFNKKLSDLYTSCTNLIDHSSQKFNQQLDTTAKLLANAAEVGDANTLDAARAAIDLELEPIRATITKNSDLINNSIENTYLQFANVEASIVNRITEITNKLTADIGIAIKKVTVDTDDKLCIIESNLNAYLADSLAKQDDINNTIFKDILSQLEVLKENTKKLRSTDDKLYASISALDNTLTAIINNVAKEVSTLSAKHDDSYSKLSLELRTQAEAMQAADSKIIADFLEYITKIYAELSDLVDDDILILEKVFSVENIFASKINEVNKAIAELRQMINQLAQEGLADVTVILHKKIADVEASLKESIENISVVMTSELEVAVSLLDSKIIELTGENASEISKLKSAIAGGVHFIGVTESALFDNCVINPIIIAGNHYTAVPGDVTLYEEKEFIWTGAVWSELGDLSRVGKLDTWRASLNTSDSALLNQFITSVEQADGRIYVSRARPTANNIEYNGESLTVELESRARAFAELEAQYIRFNKEDNSLSIGNEDGPIIFYCGSAEDI